MTNPLSLPSLLAVLRCAARKGGCVWLTLTGREKNNDNGNGSKKDKWDGGGLRSVTPFPPWCSAGCGPSLHHANDT